MYSDINSSPCCPHRDFSLPRRDDAPGLFAGLLRRWRQARRRRMDDEIGRLLAERGGKFTDSFERCVERRYFR